MHDPLDRPFASTCWVVVFPTLRSPKTNAASIMRNSGARLMQRERRIFDDLVRNLATACVPCSPILHVRKSETSEINWGTHSYSG